MKNIFKLCATAALVISSANSAFASETADLKVQGTLIMGSCTPTLTSDGVVDFGKISLNSLSATDVNQLGTKHITLTLTCQSPTKVAWTTLDNQSDTVIDTAPVVDDVDVISTAAGEYGLGKTTDGISIGSYGIIAENNGQPLADGVVAQMIYSDDSAATWLPGTNGGVTNHSDGLRLVTFADADHNPIEFTTASDVLGVGAAVQDTTTLAITDDTPLTGEATISIKYL